MSPGDDRVCPACSSGQVEPWPTPDSPAAAEHEVWRCADCRIGFTLPRLTLEQLAPHYPPTYFGPNNQRFGAGLEGLLKWARERRAGRLARLHPPGSVLDIGCGRGWTLAAMRARGWSVAGIELDETAARHAREVLGLPVRVGGFDATLEPGGEAPERYDAIILWHVLEHLIDAPGALAAVADRLEPGGILALAVPNLDSWQARTTGRGWFHLDLPRHRWHFAAGPLCRQLERLGLSIERIDHLSWEQNLFGWLQSGLNRLGLPANLLYDRLKRPGARQESEPRGGIRWLGGLSVVLALLLLPMAATLTVLEALAGAGGTVEIHARRRDPRAS